MAGTLLLVALLAQSAPAGASGSPPLDRVRQALIQPPAISIPAELDNTGKPVFRVRIEAWTFRYKAWEDPPRKGTVPSYVRPSMPLSHYEFLKMVTPEAFRDTTLYPGMIGVTIDLDAMARRIRKRHHEAEERRAAEEVRRDFDAYLRARAEVR